MTEATDTLRECKDRYIQSLVAIGIDYDEAICEAQIVLTTLLDLSAHQLLAGYDRAIGGHAKRFDQVIEQRRLRVPLQYVLGHTFFMGLEFVVAPGVLIPRPDTEHLVERALTYIKDNKLVGAKILEVGPGSGCICVSILKACPDATATALDVSSEALVICRQNAKKHAVDERLTLIHADFLDEQGAKLAAQAISRGIDLLVSNPPYINPVDMQGLAPEVKDHEPTIALAGPDEDGMGFYRRFAAMLERRGNRTDNPAIALVVEVGYDQGAKVASLFADHGLTQIEISKDLSGIDRVVFALACASI